MKLSSGKFGQVGTQIDVIGIIPIFFKTIAVRFKISSHMFRYGLCYFELGEEFIEYIL